VSCASSSSDSDPALGDWIGSVGGGGGGARATKFRQERVSTVFTYRLANLLVYYLVQEVVLQQTQLEYFGLYEFSKYSTDTDNKSKVLLKIQFIASSSDL
jgi:hypothetical protein